MTGRNKNFSIAHTRDWRILPKNAMLQILSYLPDNDRFSFASTCANWNSVLRTPSLWRTKVFQFSEATLGLFPLPSRPLRLVKMVGRYLRHVTLEIECPTSTWIEKMSKELQQFFRALWCSGCELSHFKAEYMNLGCWFDDFSRISVVEALAKFIKSQPNLVSLNLRYALMSLNEAKHICDAIKENAFEKLEELNVDGVTNGVVQNQSWTAGMFSKMPSLHRLAIDLHDMPATDIMSLSRSSPNLRNLYITYKTQEELDEFQLTLGVLMALEKDYRPQLTLEFHQLSGLANDEWNDGRVINRLEWSCFHLTSLQTMLLEKLLIESNTRFSETLNKVRFAFDKTNSIEMVVQICTLLGSCRLLRSFEFKGVVKLPSPINTLSTSLKLRLEREDEYAKLQVFHFRGLTRNKSVMNDFSNFAKTYKPLLLATGTDTLMLMSMTTR